MKTSAARTDKFPGMKGKSDVTSYALQLSDFLLKQVASQLQTASADF
jgi:hypothetical protein